MRRLIHIVISTLVLLQVTISPAQAGQCDLIELDKDYVGEQNFNKTIYLSKSARKRHEIRINKQGLIVDAQGNLFDTRHLPNGTAMFVYSKDGKMYLTKKRSPLKFDHSSLVAGEEVIVAGEMNIRRGYLKVITDVSAMYVTSKTGNLKSSIYRLKVWGANLKKMRVFFHFRLASNVVEHYSYDPVTKKVSY